MKEASSSATTIPGPRRLFAEAWQLYRSHYKTFLKISLVILSMYVVAVLLMISLFISYFFVKDNPLVVMMLIGISFFVVLAIVLGLQFLVGWSQLAMLAVVKKNDISWRDAYRTTKKLVWPYFLFLLLMGLVVMGGMGLFIIPGLIFAFWFSQAVFVFFEEHRRGFDVLLASREYVRGKFWIVIGRGLALTLFLILMQSPFFIVELLIKTNDLNSSFGVVINMAGNLFSVVVLTPLALIYSYHLFTYLKKQRGEISVEVTKKKKKIFIGFAVFGLFVPGVFAALIMALIYFVMSTHQPNIRDTIRLANENQLRIALEKYYGEHGDYPSMLSSLSPTYIRILPFDPLTHLAYPYELSQMGQQFSICPHFEEVQAGCVQGTQNHLVNTSEDQERSSVIKKRVHPSLPK